MRSFTVFMIFLSVFLFVSCENSVNKTTDKEIVNDDDAGNTGNTGDSGDTGNTGNTGDSGNSGDSGDTGNTGNTGNTGDTGNSGNTGNSGDTGNSGNTGNTGNSGDTGDTGGGCYKNDECDENFFCQKPDGLCNDKGECEIIPATCGEIYFPVCGCDGNNYSNPCLANGESVNVFYTTVCMKDLKTASMTFSYEKDGIGKETMTGGVTFNFDGQIYELLLLSTPTSQNDGDIAHVSAVFNGINGITVVFKFDFQREPFKLPQTFDLETSGQNTAEVKTDFGTTIGFLTGKLTVTKYQVGIGGLNFLEMNSPELSFAK